MRQIQKNNEPKSLLQYRLAEGTYYENYQYKDDLRLSLLQEQGYLCCYCMGRIRLGTMKIEHWIPQSISQNPDSGFDQGLELDYKNLFGVCRGNEGKRPSSQHCDTHKGQLMLRVFPADKPPSGLTEKFLSIANQNCERLVNCSSDGTVYSDNPYVNEDLGEENYKKRGVLNLNLPFLVQNRKEALGLVVQQLCAMASSQEWSKQTIAKKINLLKEKDINGELSPYCQIAVAYLEKRLSR